MHYKQTTVVFIMGTIIHLCELMYPKLKVLVMLLCSEDPVTYCPAVL